MQIAIVNKSKSVSDADVAFWAEACNAQVIECAAAWGIDPTPVAFYATDKDLPAHECRIMSIVDGLDVQGALGYHDDWAGTVYANVLAQGPSTSVTLSHECLEELVDPTCDAWAAMSDGRATALEACDAVEEDEYLEPVTVLGETRNVRLSNYLHPKWFDRAGGPATFDRMGRLTAPFTMTAGGYMIMRDASGNVSNVFAAHVPASMGRKLGDPQSRTLRRLRGRWAP